MGPGLEDVHVLELGPGERLADRLEIDRLPARHAARAAGEGDKLDQLELVLRPVRDPVLGQELEREALQRVAREQRGGLVELHVAGGLAAAQDVVPCTQVVVDEGRRGELDARPECARARPWPPPARRHRTPAWRARACRRRAWSSASHRAGGWARSAGAATTRRAPPPCARRLLAPKSENPGARQAGRNRAGSFHLGGGRSRSSPPSSTAIRAWASLSRPSQNLISSAPRW